MDELYGQIDATTELGGTINQTTELTANLTPIGDLSGTINTLDNLSGILNKNGELLGNLNFPIRIGGYIVYDAYVNNDGYLMFILYDDSEINAGYVRGDKGDAFEYSDFTPEQLALLASGSTFVYEQMVSSAHWIIDHPLSRYPSVVVVDTAGSTVIGEVVYISLNRVEIQFSAPFSGKAYLT